MHIPEFIIIIPVIVIVVDLIWTVVTETIQAKKRRTFQEIDEHILLQHMATGETLDAIALQYYMIRSPGETDEQFKKRIVQMINESIGRFPINPQPRVRWSELNIRPYPIGRATNGGFTIDIWGNPMRTGDSEKTIAWLERWHRR